jgi:hypothetical protein
MQLCQQLIANSSVGKLRTLEQIKSGNSAVLEWYGVLKEATRASARLGAMFDDIPDEPDAAKRALAFFPIISAVVKDIDSSSTSQDNIKRFLIHVAWHEGARLTTRIQSAGGPARSFFQFEAFRAKETLAIAHTKGWSGKLAAASGQTEKDLSDAQAQLPDYDPKDSSCSFFPDGNLIKTLLETNDSFGTYLARIAFTAFAAAIGNTNAQHADYWYKYWKRSGGDETKLKATFIKEAGEVDALIVPLIQAFHFIVNKIDNSLVRSGGTWLQMTKTTVTNTYFDRSSDDTWIYMDDGAKGVVELRIPVGGGDGLERLYRKGSWHLYQSSMVPYYG